MFFFYSLVQILTDQEISERKKEKNTEERKKERYWQYNTDLFKHL